MRDVVAVIEERQRRDDEQKKRSLGQLRRLRYNAWHKEDDKEKVKSLQQRVDDARRSFHVSYSAHSYLRYW